VSPTTQRPRVTAFRTVRARLLFWILAVTIPIYSAALYISYDATAHRLEKGAERDADALAARLAAELDAVIRPIEGGIRTVAYQLESVDPPRSQYAQRIHGILGAWPTVYGSTIAVEVNNELNKRDSRAQPFAPYYFRHGEKIDYSDLALDSYGYRELPWYRRAADAKQPVWSAPYFDAGGGEIWMVTYSVPFFRKLPDARRVLAGVITADLDLDWVRKTATDVTLGPAGMGWLSTPPDGKSFVAPIGASIDRIAKFDAAMNQDAVRRAGETMLANHSTFALLPSNISAKPAYLAARHLETLEWRLMLVIPQVELLGEARALLNRQIWLGAIGLVLLIAAITVVATGVARPIHTLAESVGRASDSDSLDFQLPEIARRDEVGVLTEALRRMRDSLQEHIRLRATSLAEQARLEHELQIAASIQQSMLPQSGAAALSPSVEIAAALLPAKQVGGDLYDYFTVRDGEVLFAVGDVSDKGIPAALFMARLSALLRVLGTTGEYPDRLLSIINTKLAEGNDACMFVTLGCGVLNLESGRIRYASAGHESPLLRQLDGTVRPLATENGAAIGIDTIVDYQLCESYIAPGDTLVLFTDGVTEAEDESGKLWGTERLISLLSAVPDAHPIAIVKQIVATVAAHASGFHATDDLTVMAVRFNPPNVASRRSVDGCHWLIEVDPSPKGILNAQLRLRGILESRSIEHGQIADSELIVEELLTNIVRAANSGRRIQLTLDCALTQLHIIFTARDNGPEFNPLAMGDPNLEADLTHRDVGGLGIHLIRQLANECRYDRVDGWNVFAARLYRAPDTASNPDRK
jgi:sigma-B regulation protein RsbU (phosphoserine phosphatase)